MDRPSRSRGGWRNRSSSLLRWRERRAAMRFFSKAPPFSRNRNRQRLEHRNPDVHKRRAPPAHFLEAPLDRRGYRLGIVHPLAVAARRFADLDELDVGRKERV